MDFLNKIEAKADQKPISVLSHLPFCPCDEPNHQMYTLNMVCVEKTCAKKGLICVMCNYEKHKLHEYIPLKNFLDQYQKSHYTFHQKSNKDELKVEKIREINWETLTILKNFLDKITKEVHILEEMVKSYSAQEINHFIEEEENNKDPLLKMSGWEQNCTTKQAMSLITSLLDRIIYKENEGLDTDNIQFLHPSNEILVRKFEDIKQKAKKNQEIVTKKLDDEYENVLRVFKEMGIQFGVLEKAEEIIEKAKEPFGIEKKTSYVLKSDFTALCFFDEIVNNQKIEFLSTESEDNRFKLFRFENSQEESFFYDLHIKHSIKHLDYCKKQQLLICIDNECNLSTFRFKNQSPYFLPIWTSHHFKDLFSRSEAKTKVIGNYLIIGANSFIYIMNITQEGFIEIKVKIEINGTIELLSEGDDQIFFVWNKQNGIKKNVSVLEVEKGTIINLETFEINYKIKGFFYNKVADAFLFWGFESKGNKEFLDVVQSEKKKRIFLEKSIRAVKQDAFDQNLYLFLNNNSVEILRIYQNS